MRVTKAQRRVLEAVSRGDKPLVVDWRSIEIMESGGYIERELSSNSVRWTLTHKGREALSRG